MVRVKNSAGWGERKLLRTRRGVGMQGDQGKKQRGGGGDLGIEMSQRGEGNT